LVIHVNKIISLGEIIISDKIIINNKNKTVMANARVYTNETKEDKSTLQLSWSKNQIHFDINQEDGTYLSSLTFTPYDIEVMIEELELFAEAAANNITKEELRKSMDKSERADMLADVINNLEK